MNRNLLGNFSIKTSSIFVENGNKKPGRGVLGLVFLAVFGVFFGGTAWGQTPITSLSTIAEDPSGNYIITQDIIGGTTGVATFTGTLTAQAKSDGTFPVITGLTQPLFTTVTGATISNIMLKNVAISGSGSVGAIACTANGATRIYNCGILPGTITYNENGVITGTGSTVASSNGYCGGLVGELSGNARVINCFSYAFITGGSTVAGIVGYNGNTEIKQSNVTTVPMVVNCMFYGDITGGTTRYPVYGGAMIKNDRTDGVNPYNYFRKSATFDNAYDPNQIDLYKRSWPAEEKNLVRFEYYRSVLNSNRKLCTYWVTDKQYGSTTNAPTAEDEALIAKWVLDKSMAPYPILKKWGKYPSIINPDPARVWDPRTTDANGTPVTPHWVQRENAKEWEGKSLGTLSVTINGGAQNSSASETRVLTITDVDTLNYDYCAYKVQLPYYNEVFGDPTKDPATQWAQRYANNYTNYVVTGWMIDAVSSEGTNHFVADWQTGYDFADRQCTDKDLYATSGRVFAQGGYYYVPEGVTSITITAKWGKAFYLANRGHSIDQVNVTKSGSYKSGSHFDPAGSVATTFQGKTVYNDLQAAIKALDVATVSNNVPNRTVFDQAIVLISNHQVKNGGTKYQGSQSIGYQSVGYNLDNKWHPFTIMSADFDFDNEPDYCLELQFRENVDRPGIQPVRFDFLPVVELGLAVRHNNLAYAIGIFVPQGYFEITETSFMRTTQFEYDADLTRIETRSPVIINGGEHELFNIRYPVNSIRNRTSYFILGGHVWVHRFAPGPHPNNNNPSLAKVCLCAVNAIGGEYPEFYLSGINRPDYTPPALQKPHCYTNGGKFGMMAGAGYEKVEGDVTFKINRSLIDEFYGGGINGSKPVGGKIDIVVDNSKVRKFCGGPRVGSMESDKTVTTNATGTIFGTFYGGGNGGNSYFRQNQDDGDWDAHSTTEGIDKWDHRNYRWGKFNPLNLFTQGTTTPEVYDDGNENKGYHCEYECEVFNQSNGLADQVTKRGYVHWIQFGTTITGNVTNTLSGCTVEHNFYGGGNLGNVTGTVTSTLTDCTVKGSVFGGGYSATVPTFNAEDKDASTFPSMDAAGTITEGTIPYMTDENGVISYEWTNNLNNMTLADRKKNPTYRIGDKWYCYTWKSLAGLGVVTSDVELTIKGNSRIDGNVFGGGDMSEVEGKTTVKLQGGTNVGGNVYGGGNEGIVHGDSKVFIQNEQNVTPTP